MRILGFALRIVAGLALAVLVAFLFGWIVQHLWNWLMPVLFHLPTVTFWQAAGLVFLSRLLFGNIGGGHHGKGWKKRHRKWRDCHPYAKPVKPSAFAPGGDYSNWEHFDEWWEQGGQARFDAFAGGGHGCWNWWKWWKSEGRPEYEVWLKERHGS